MSLTPSERARLNPRINVERLETFLERSRPDMRQLALNSCYLDPEPDCLTVVGSTDPELDLLWRQVWGGGDAEVEAPPA
jgi:hypothetical protein